MRTTSRAVVLSGLVMSAVVLGGCGGGASGTFEAEPPMASDSMMVEADRSAADVAPQVITTANVFLEVDSLDTAVGSVRELTDGMGGSIEAQSVYRQDDSASATMTLRVPAGELDAFLAHVAQIGEVRSTDLNSQDVTLEVIDLEARITTLQDSIERLRELQAQSASVADLVAVETELANRQSELESLTARRDYLARQVDMSTVYLTLSEEQSGPRITPDFLGGLQRGWDALLTLGAGLITGVGFLAPTAVAVGLLLVAIFVIIRYTRYRRRRHERHEP